jgi:hypothetical protein
MSEIHYNFDPNNETLNGVNGNVDSIQGLRNDIHDIFNTLTDVYDGQGAQALQAAHAKVSGMLEEALNNMHNTQRRALDQQADMQALDRLNAASL